MAKKKIKWAEKAKSEKDAKDGEEKPSGLKKRMGKLYDRSK